MKTQTSTTIASWQAREAFSNVLMAFAKDPNFKEKAPGALLYAPLEQDPSTFTFSEPADEPALHGNLLKAQMDVGRSVIKKGKIEGGQYVSIVLNDGAALILFGWAWNDGLAFLLAFAKQLALEVPFQAGGSLSKPARDALPEAVRMLL